MRLVDATVLVAAHRVDHDLHTEVLPWLDDFTSHEDFGVPAGVWATFLRLVTNRRVFVTPSPRVDAFAFIDAIVRRKHYVPIEPGPDHLGYLRAMCDEGDATGDLIPDAVLGAIAREHGAHVATLDRDFARFPSVETVRPPD